MDCDSDVEIIEERAGAAWSCRLCTMYHEGDAARFLACQVCDAPRVAAATCDEEATPPSPASEQADAIVESYGQRSV